MNRRCGVWWARGECISVNTVDELDAALDGLAANNVERPIMLIVNGPSDESIFFGLGPELSFVASCQSSAASLGDPNSKGLTDFWFHGIHAPVYSQYTIPTSLARRIVREFFHSGRLPLWQAWEVPESNDH